MERKDPMEAPPDERIDAASFLMVLRGLVNGWLDVTARAFLAQHVMKWRHHVLVC